MNVAISRRIGRVMSLMIPSLTILERALVVSSAESARAFAELPKWIQDRVVEAEKALPNVDLSNFEEPLPSIS